jgi:hypothetical protein
LKGKYCEEYMARHKRKGAGTFDGIMNSTAYNNLNIVEDIKIRRLGWAGHIIRMEDERIPKMVLNRRFHNTRTVGRPRARWADAVQRDSLQILGTRGWRRKAENRDEWRQLLREAKARKGL